MNGSSSTVRLGVVALHAAGWDGCVDDRFRSGTTEVVARVQQRLKALHPSVELEAKFLTSNEEASSLRDWRSACAVAVLDTSAHDEALMLRAGCLLGSGVPTIVISDSDSKESARLLGASNLIVYGSMDELFQTDSSLEVELLRAFPRERIHEELVYRFWFPRETSTIWVVCPQDHDPSEYADRSNPDYTYLDNLGDEDALLELMVFLSRHYPNATIGHFSSGDLPEGHTGGNLVVLGGPGSVSSISNRICREMMEAIDSRVSYSEDCEHMEIGLGGDRSLGLHAEYRKETGGVSGAQRRIRQDVGYFAHFPNPVNEECAVVLVNGIHTTGVLGSARAFSDRREALQNFHAVLGSGVGAMSFECHFGVRVLNGHVRVPSVESGHVFPVAVAAAERAAATERRPVGEARRRRSATVLFIAGDRGGSHLNQIQTGNEYHAIQEALRASRYRDAISIGGPILTATRERLAQAYRYRPQVVHFVGHGNNRNLSIIEDHGVTANETPLDASQLGAVLQAMQDPILLCVLNACESAKLADELVSQGAVKTAVGWPGRVSDSIAIEFSRVLYGALGDGMSIAGAVEAATQVCGAGDRPVLMGGESSAAGALVEKEEEEGC